MVMYYSKVKYVVQINKYSRILALWANWGSNTSKLRGVMGEISVILVKNYFFMWLHKFNLHNLIYDSLKFQTSVTGVQ